MCIRDSLFPSHLPPRMKNWRDKYEHHLLLKMAGDGVGEAKSWLVDYFKQAEGDFFVCTPEEGSKAFLHRFAAAGAAIRYQAVHSDEVEDILALDIALRRNDTEWYEHLPPEIDSQLVHKLYYGHFMCYVCLLYTSQCWHSVAAMFFHRGWRRLAVATVPFADTPSTPIHAPLVQARR